LEDSTKFLYRQVIIKYLSVHLNRQPTEEEIIAEAKRCNCEYIVRNDEEKEIYEGFYET
jgi:hypothetical protein